MKAGDLVVGTNFQYKYYGVGVIMSTTYWGIKVWWLRENTWCYLSSASVKKCP